MQGTIIGQYRIVQQIGAGGMGVVYVAEHVLVGRRAAIKVLLPEYSVRRALVTRFFNEARAMTSIPDPGIVQMYDFGFHGDGSAYIVMGLLEGETLERRLQRLHRLPLLDALRITRQLAGSLDAAHAAGVIHRDLKPENVFMVRDPEALGGEPVRGMLRPACSPPPSPAACRNPPGSPNPTACGRRGA
jgi:serine/threonine-protein kinase